MSRIDIVTYPGVMQSAVNGIQEMYILAERIYREKGKPFPLQIQLVDVSQLNTVTERADFVLLPPCIDDVFYPTPSEELLDWLRFQHQQGAVLCSACAGAFVLAATGLLDGRRATTHWHLASEFQGMFPEVALEPERLLINDNDLITAGGLMSWLDLGLELVAMQLGPSVMKRLGRYMVVDTAPREQRYYHSFTPKMDHGDKQVLALQHHLQKHFHEAISVADMADFCSLGQRTFLRRFQRATTMTPSQYLQRLRVQKACEMLELKPLSFEQIAWQTGYEDAGSLRKVFVRIMGLSPQEFRQRFANYPRHE